MMENQTFRRLKRHLCKIAKFIYCASGYVLWILLIISFYIKVQNGGSLVRSILHFQIMTPFFLKLNAIGKVAETIGISSILIVWLYSSLDKQELGLKYIDILKEQNKFFYLYTVSHILSILISIWASKCSAIEIGTIALCIVFWGCLVHGVFLWKLLFNVNTRKKLSKNIWKHRILNNSDADFLKTVYSLTDMVDIKVDFDTNAACDLVCLAMNEFPKKSNNSVSKKLPFYSSFWKNLLENHPEEKRNIIFKLVFRNLIDSKYTELNPKIYACAGYILWMYKYTLDIQECANKEQSTLIDIQVHLESLNLNHQPYKEINTYLSFFYSALIWLIFLNKRITLNSYLLDKCNAYYSLPETISIEEYLQAFATCLQIQDNRQIKICMKQLINGNAGET